VTARIEVSSECGVVALGDGQARLPAGLDQKVLLRQLEPLARSAQIFFMVSDDPVRYRMDVMAEETLSPGLDREFEPLGGTFRLDVPNGRVALVGWDKVGEPREAGAVSVRPGVYLLSVLTRRPFDGARHAEDMAKLLGADWKFMRIVDRLGSVRLPSIGPHRNLSSRSKVEVALVRRTFARRVLAAVLGSEVWSTVPGR